jgi:hypothetical protein
LKGEPPLNEPKRRFLGAALRNLLIAVALVGVTALVTSQVLSQDKEGEKGKYDIKGKIKEAMPGMPEGMSMEEMEKLWEQKNQPGEHHRHLQALAGTWKAECKCWMAPGTEPQVSEGINRVTPLFGGRYIKQEYQGKFNEKSFEGIGYLGYDNAAKKYNSSWIDSMSTAICFEEGTCDASGKVFTFGGEHVCPMDGTPKKSQNIMRIINKDKYEFEMHIQAA